MTAQPLKKSFGPSVLKLIYVLLIILTLADFSFVAYSLAFNDPQESPPDDLQTDLTAADGPRLLQENNLKPLPYYEELVDRRNIFQFDMKQFEPEPAQDATGPAAEEIKKLKLAGVLFDADPQAIVKDPATRETFFLEVGGSVRGASVKEIHENSIVLDLQGQTIVLNLGGSLK